MINTLELLEKYNVAAPRYTSYPTVPYWEVDKFDINQWHISVRNCYNNSKNDLTFKTALSSYNPINGASIYVFVWPGYASTSNDDFFRWHLFKKTYKLQYENVSDMVYAYDGTSTHFTSCRNGYSTSFTWKLLAFWWCY